MGIEVISDLDINFIANWKGYDKFAVEIPHIKVIVYNDLYTCHSGGKFNIGVLCGHIYLISYVEAIIPNCIAEHTCMKQKYFPFSPVKVPLTYCYYYGNDSSMRQFRVFYNSNIVWKRLLKLKVFPPF